MGHSNAERMSHYDALGVDKNADRATIKRAYRKKAHENHPDKGGSAETFHAVQKAYDVLSDDARRAWYDRNGTDGQINPEDEALKNLGALFIQVVDQADVDHQDVLQLVRDNIQNARTNLIGQIDQQKAKVRKLESAKRRVTKKSAGPSMLSQMLDAQIAANKRAMELGAENLKIFARMLAMLDEYTYKADAGRMYPQGAFFSVRMG